MTDLPGKGGPVAQGPPLEHNDGGNGGGGGMLERIAVLEAEVGHIKTDISEIKQDFREVKKDLKDLAVALAGVNTSISLAKWLVPVLVSIV